MSVSFPYRMPPITPVVSAEQVPSAVDVAIVGGGIIGVSAAFELARQGVRVAVLEKGFVGGEQSGRNWGWVRLAGRDTRELPLMLQSHSIWETLHQETGVDVGYRKRGIIYTAKTAQARERYDRWAGAARDFGIDVRNLAHDDVAHVVTGLGRKTFGGIFVPQDAAAEPQLAAPAIAARAQRDGAVILQNCAVRGLDIEAGRVAGVVTEKGRIRASTVIVAGGVWSSHFLRRHGVRLPQLKVLSSVMRTAPVEAGIEPTVGFSDFTLRKRMDGGYTVASSATSLVDIVPDSFRFFREFFPAFRMERKSLTLNFGKPFFDALIGHRARSLTEKSIYEKIRVLDPSPDKSFLTKVEAHMRASVPALRDVAIAQSWGGMIDTMPDVIPVISQVEALPGLIIGTGFSGHGFGIGPGAGRLLSDLAMGDVPCVDPSPFRFSRFSDGSRLEIQHWL
ncbi:glycine/D-amino acid oxidase-like deaminating enzyme [Agrobacterium larrymoorei]|uniref:Glycine/D-amino acid oxidase-like deaminating enzyme n=1 Tax=Agrobacterium larrymoorei TaxID=160699 RepID=A0AAJ2EUP4_9HYPH|nr:FAD-binding oxidoreductase [Agrobacterium larrymoorei]MDR6101652.1 glycine/D-amino acid oxidase-like deaminating enzyme [Agrobacterium larrymoorei]